MKTRDIVAEIRNRGFERGVLYVLQTINERQNNLDRGVAEIATMQARIIDSLANVVNGAGAMRAEMIQRLREAGLARPEDGIEPNTHEMN